MRILSGERDLLLVISLCLEKRKILLFMITGKDSGPIFFSVLFTNLFMLLLCTEAAGNGFWIL
jgi:hypothetical protein